MITDESVIDHDPENPLSRGRSHSRTLGAPD